MERLINSANEDIQSLANKKKTLAEYLVNNCISVGDWKNAATACNDLRELDAKIEIMVQVRNVVTQLSQSDSEESSTTASGLKAVENQKTSGKKSK
jgi:hypothetical protein